MGDKVPISAEQARAAYDAGGIGEWHKDSRWGLFLALDRAVEQELVRRVYRAHKRSQGARQRPDKPVAAWVASAFDDFRPLFAAMQLLQTPIPLPFGRMLATTEGRAVVEELVERNSIDTLLSVADDALATLIPIAEDQVAAYAPRARAELKAFFIGTRLWFQAAGKEDPTARTLALLAAGVGVEEIDEGLDRARSRWDERLTRWRPELDEGAPNWREIANAEPVR